MLNRKTAFAVLSFILIAFASEARASSLFATNESDESGTVCCFQATEIYGELFTASDNVLADFAFKLSSSAPDFSAAFGVAKWDPVAGGFDGVSIYGSSVTIASGADQWIGASNMNLGLTPGSIYVAFLINLSSEDSARATFAQALGGGPIGQGGVHSYFSLGTLQWYPIFGYDLVYRASFQAAVTPIPGALPLFASALGGLGLVVWRRRTATTARPS